MYRQEKCHLKIDIYAIVTIHQLSYCFSFAISWRGTLQLDSKESCSNNCREMKICSVVCSRCPQNRKCGYFMLLFYRGRENCFKVHAARVGARSFFNISNQIHNLWRYHYHFRRYCISFLLASDRRASFI